MRTKTETIDYYLLPILTPIEYKGSHNKKGHYIHWKMYKYDGILDCEKWYKHQPYRITEEKGTDILWDFAIQNDRKVKSKRPDILVKDGKRKNMPSN